MQTRYVLNKTLKLHWENWFF